MRKCYALFAVLTAFFIVFVSGASAILGQEQGNARISDANGVALGSRGVQATVSASPAPVVANDDWVLDNIRLLNSGLPNTFVQVGWFKQGSSTTGVDDCLGANQAKSGIFIEWVVNNGTFHCRFHDTPTGLTWGQAILFQIKYVGKNQGNHSTDGDFTVTYGATTEQVNDLGTNLACGSSLPCVAGVGSEITTDQDTYPPSNYVTYSALGRQPNTGNVNNAFIVAQNVSNFNTSSGFQNVFGYNGNNNTNSGTIYFTPSKFQNYVHQVMLDSPVAYWQNQDVTGFPVDSSGHGNDIQSAYPGGCIAYQKPGPISDSAIELYRCVEGRATVSSAYLSTTFETWIKVPFGSNNSNGNLFRNADMPFQGWGVGLSAYDGFVRVHGIGFNYGLCGSLGCWGTDSSNMSLNTWHLLDVESNGGIWQYYIDGQLDSGNAGINYASNYNPAAWSTEIGELDNASNQAIQLAHTAVYDTALSASRILAHYQAATG